MQIEIREYTSKDRESLLTMATELMDLMSSIDPHHLFRSKNEFDAKKYFEARLNGVLEAKGKVLIAFVDKKPVGYLTATIEQSAGIDALNKIPTTIGDIKEIFVSDAFRGQGVSTLLLDSIEKFFKESGCEFSGVSCLVANDAARKIYSKKGYEERYIDFLKKL